MLLLNITSGSNSVCIYITPERRREREREKWGGVEHVTKIQVRHIWTDSELAEERKIVKEGWREWENKRRVVTVIVHLKIQSYILYSIMLCGTQKGKCSRMSELLFSIQWKQMGTGTVKLQKCLIKMYNSCSINVVLMANVLHFKSSEAIESNSYHY